MNLKKPPHKTLYITIGAKFRTDFGRLYFPEIWIQALTTCVRSFPKVGAYKLAHQFLSLLGLIAAMLQLVEDTHLHMRPIQ